MRRPAAILIAISVLCSCQKETGAESACGWLCIEGLEMNGLEIMLNASKGSMDADMALDILTADGEPIQGYSYSAGSVPEKIQLPAGNYRLNAYSSNIGSWRTMPDEKGSAVYRIEQAFDIEPEMCNYVKIEAPLVNYGLRFKIDEDLYGWFTAFSVAVTESPSRTVTLQENETGWFDAQTVSVVITATNRDNDTFSGAPFTLEAENGHLYTLEYKLSPSGEGAFSLKTTED